MSDFKVIIPEATENIFVDPVAGNSDPANNWTIAGDGSTPDVIRYTDDAFFGDGCFQFDIDDGTLTTLYQTTTVTASDYTLSCYVKRSGGGTVSNTEVKCWFDNAAVNFDSITLIRDGWYYCVYTATPTAGSRQFGVRALEASLQADGCQLENKAYATTLAWGDFDGFRADGYQWTGSKNASTSTRHAQERSGGRVRDWVTDLSVNSVRNWNGGGYFEEEIITSDAAQLPGSIYHNNKIQPRFLDFSLSFYNASAAPHSERYAFLNAIRTRKVTPIQPFVLRYTGGTEPLEINARLAGGMGLGFLQKYIETPSLRLFCENPFWRSLGNGSAQLDPNDSLTTNYIAQRTTAGWSNLATSLDGAVRGLAKAPDGTIYIVGDFTSPGNYAASWDGSSLSALSTGMPFSGLCCTVDSTGQLWAGITGASIRFWNGSSWSGVTPSNSNTYDILADTSDNIWCVGDGDTLEYYDQDAAGFVKQAAATADGIIYAILVDGNDIYFGGAFTSIGGVSSAGCAKLDTVTGTWTDIGLSAGTVYALGKLGNNLYIGGDFTNQGDANGDYIIYWDGSALNSMGTGCDAAVYSITVVGSNVYLGGIFTAAGGVSNTLYIAYWNGSTFVTMGNSADTGQVTTLSNDGTDVYAGGQFTTIAGVSNTARIAKWDVSASSWSALSTGIGSGDVYAMAFDSDGNLYIGGSFTNVGDANGDYIVEWNGSTFSSLSTGAGNNVRALAAIGTCIYLGGDFTNLGEANGDYAAYWDGSNFNALHGGFSAAVHSMATFGNSIVIGGNFTNSPGDRLARYWQTQAVLTGVTYGNESNVSVVGDIYAIARDASDNSYIGGAFLYVLKVSSLGLPTPLGGLFSDAIRTLAINPSTGNLWAGGENGLLAYWNGIQWNTIDTSLTTEIIYALAWDDDGKNLYIGGDFTTIGGVDAEAVARYSGGNFYQVDIDLPSTPTVYAILIDGDEITVGFSTAGSATTPGVVTVSNGGTADAYPTITMTGPGTVRQLKNETTGRVIQFTGLTLGSSETVTLRLGLLENTFTSDVRKPSNVIGKIQQSDLSEFVLMPGDNDISLFISDASATAAMTFDLLHESVDGANG